MKLALKDGCALVFADGRLSFTAKDGRLGWRGIGFTLTTDKGTELFAPDAPRRVGKKLVLRARYPVSELEETVEIEPLPNRALAVTRTVKNPTAFSRELRNAAAGRVADTGGPSFADNSVWRLRFAHLDNLRTEDYPWCRPDYPLVRPLPRTPTFFGNTEGQALPVLMLTNDAYTEMLVEGQLRQDAARLRWRLAGGHNALFADYALEWDWHTGGVTLPPGESFALEPVFYQILENTHPQDALADYFAAAVARNRFPQDGNPLHSKAFYCSWNYGIFQQIDEASLLKTARTIARDLPDVSHFLIDGGWQKRDAVACPDCSAFYLKDETEWYDRAKFPHGMKGMATRLRAAGIAPAIWWTPAVSLSSKLAQEKPHWLAKDRDGAPYRIDKFGYLDYSHPEAQAYLCSIFDIIFKRWGFEAMKMDFWSQSVESNRIRFGAGTGIQWRDWLLGTIRGYLPPGGFLMTCVATAMGNAFLGKHAHTYRACIDVGAFGHWREHVYASCWVQGMLPFPGRETILMNVDGLGVNPKLSDDENLHRLTYGFITMGSLEIDGRLEELAPRHMDWLRRLTAHIDRGYPCRTVGDEAFTGAPYPAVLYVPYPAGSPTRRRGVRQHVALFNWGATPAFVGATWAQLGLERAVPVRDFWTDAERTFGADGIAECLPAHAARLYEVVG